MTALSEPARVWHTLVLGGALSLGSLLTPSAASACGGFFCQATNPVNQAAERIIFSSDSGQVSAVIEIKYEGPSTSFSWLLPIAGVPDKIGVASTLAFDLLQQATNPQYNLTTRVDGTCAQPKNRFDSGSAGPSSAQAGTEDFAANGHSGVTVEASGVVGAFEWTVISLDASITDPAAAAVKWLGANGYDVPQGAPGLLGPYLQDGLNLLALKLKKGATTGSIRPIVLTYAADKPMIPIKLTSVAASENMGVLAWVLGEARAVPMNYYSLELNEARINWFSASSNYGDVVNAAADDAGGQGFVTEMSGSTASLRGLVFSDVTASDWQQIQAEAQQDQLLSAYDLARNSFGGADGFAEVAFAHATFATGVALAALQRCSQCYSPTEVDDGFVAALGENVVEPLRVVQNLLDQHSQLTRLYTTMSAQEMTVDPLFSFNPNLPPVSNVHTATRVVECSSEYYQDEAPWRIELPSGATIRGSGQPGAWPQAFASQPPNRRILRAGQSGAGEVLEDNGASIDAAVRTYSSSVPKPPPSVDEGCQLGRGGSRTGVWLTALAALWLFKRRR
jgi:hypothetical protein